MLLGALRVGPTVLLLPLGGLGVTAWPVRLALALTLTAGVLAAPEAPWVATWWVPCARELLAGAVLALALALPWMALSHGASLLGAPAASPGSAGPAAQWAGALAFVAARGHHGALRALGASWESLPPGAAAGAGWLRPALDATAEALAGGLLVASSGLLAALAAEAVMGLAGRFAWPPTPAGRDSARGLAGVAATALALRAIAELTWTLGQRARELAAGMR